MIYLNKKQLINAIKRILNFGFTIAMVSITVLCASADAYAWGFTAFGYEVGSKGIHKESANTKQNQNSAVQYEYQEVAEETTNKVNQNQYQNQNRNTYQYEYQENDDGVYDDYYGTETELETNIDSEDELLDISKAVEKANSDSSAQNTLKEFSGEYFSVSTEQRIAYFYVHDDGTIQWLDYQPEDCKEIKTNEAYAKRVWQKIQNRERISAKEFEDNVSIPWSMRMKVAWMGMWKSNKAAS